MAEAHSHLRAVEAIYEYVIGNISYDEAKAANISYGYLPVVDDTLETGKGICFDYAALMAAMLRSQRIPTKLEVGYAGEAYHAWISVYLKEKGWIDDIIEFDGDSWTLLDTGVFSGLYARMTSIGSRTGVLDEVMEDIAEKYQEDIDQKFSRTDSREAEILKDAITRGIVRCYAIEGA